MGPVDQCSEWGAHSPCSPVRATRRWARKAHSSPQNHWPRLQQSRTRKPPTSDATWAPTATRRATFPGSGSAGAGAAAGATGAGRGAVRPVVTGRTITLSAYRRSALDEPALHVGDHVGGAEVVVDRHLAVG